MRNVRANPLRCLILLLPLFLLAGCGSRPERAAGAPVILISIFGLSVDLAIMALAPTLVWLLLGRVLCGLTAGAQGAAMAYVADITEPEDRARRFGLVGAMFGMGFMLGPALGGYLGSIDLHLPFFVAGGMAVLNWLYGFFVLPESLPLQRRKPFEWRRAHPFSALTGLGWERYSEFETGSPFEHAANYWNPDWGYIDVHRQFPGFQATPDAVFDRLWAHRERLPIAGWPCQVPDRIGQALVLLLHAARDESRGTTEVPRIWAALDSGVRYAAKSRSARAAEATLANSIWRGKGCISCFMGFAP